VKNRSLIKGAVLVLLLISVILLQRYAHFEKYLDPEILKNWISGFGFWGPVIYILLYSIIPSLLVPGLPITIAGGILFGPIYGTIYTAVGATIGAAVSFLIARYLARELIANLLKKHKKLDVLDKEVEKQGWKIVAFTRLIPLFPYNVLNYAFGLTGIRFSHYILASFIFMLPAIVAFVVFSSSFLDLLTGKVSKELFIGIILIVIISLLPIVYKKIWR